MNKSKSIFIIASLTLTASSVWVYVGQKSTKLSQRGEESSVKARLRGYELFRYKGDELKSRVSGKVATLVEPAKLICEDDIVGFRMREGSREHASSKKAVVSFVGESLFNQKDSAISTIELDGDVDFQRGNNQFLTEWLIYTDKTAEAFTEMPVRIESPGQFVAAEGGMTYNVREESLKLRGGVIGNIRTDVMKSGIDKGGAK